MKFYFCETCGKRLTDADLSKGAAFDKEVKGIYCAACAVGVHTMQFTAITDKDLQPGGNAATPPRRRTTKAVALPAAAHVPLKSSAAQIAPATRSVPKTNAPTGSPASSTPLLYIGAGVCLGILAFAFLAFSGTAKRTPSTNRTTAEAESKVKRDAVPKLEPIAKPATPAHAPASPKPVEPPQPASVDAPVPSTEPVVPAPKPPEPATPAVAATEPSKAALDTAAPVPPAVPAAVIPPVNPEQARYEAWISLLQALAATPPGQTAVLPDELTLPAADVAMLKTLLGRIEKERQTVAAHLQEKLGQRLRLQTRTAAASGKLMKVEAGQATLAQEFVINGETRTGEAITVALAELTLDTRRMLASAAEPADAGDWAAYALQLWIDGQDVRAAAALKKATGHAVQQPFQAALELLGSRALEKRAVAAWTALEERAGKVRTGTEARAALAELDAYEKTFVHAELLKDPAWKLKREAMRQELTPLLIDADPRLHKAFRGRVVAFAPRTEELTLGYEFKRVEELEDWSLAKLPPDQPKLAKITPDGVHFNCPNTTNTILGTELFKTPGLKLILEYEADPQSMGKDPRLLVWMFGADSPGKSMGVVLQAGGGGIAFMRGDMRGALAGASEVLPVKGTLEVSCVGQVYHARLNGKLVLEYKAGDPNDHTGLRVGGGFNFTCTIKKVIISGTVNSAQLKAKMENAGK